MRPHDSQSSRENATPSSGKSPLASYKEVPPPSPDTQSVHLQIFIPISIHLHYKHEEYHVNKHSHRYL